MAHPVKDEVKEKAKSEIREEAGRAIESLAFKFAGYELGLSPEEFEDIYNNVISLYDQEQQEEEEAKRQHRVTRLYARHRAKKAVRKAIKKQIKKKVARQATQQALSRGATAGVAATEGFLAANAVDTAGVSLAIAVALQAAIEAFRFFRDPEEETKKILKIVIISIIIVVSTVIFVFYIIMVQFEIFVPKAAEELQGFILRRNSLIITKTATDVKNGEEITFKISINALEAGDITVIDTIPAGTTFVGATEKVRCEPEGPACGAATKTVTWKSTDNSLTAPFNSSFTVRVLPTVKDAFIMNVATGVVSAASAASNTDCGMYRKEMDMTDDHLNFGDPQCTFVKTDPNGKKIFDKDTLLSMLRAQDPERASDWFCLAGAESSYSPNNYLRNSTSGRGAYGLYQMNPPGRTGIPGQYDNGKIAWPTQISNALAYNNWLRSQLNIWGYWDPISRAKCNL